MMSKVITIITLMDVNGYIFLLYDNKRNYNRLTDDCKTECRSPLFVIPYLTISASFQVNNMFVYVYV